VKYELWSAESGNRLGGFDSLDELGAVVREYGELNGEPSIADLFAEQWRLGANAPSRILTGHDLLRLALPLVQTRAYGSRSAAQAVESSSRQIRYGRVEIAV
jgi:hypothetical protein